MSLPGSRRRPFVPDVLTGIPPQAVRPGCPYRDPAAGPAILAGRSWRSALYGKLPGGSGQTDLDCAFCVRAEHAAPKAQPVGSVAEYPAKGFRECLVGGDPR